MSEKRNSSELLLQETLISQIGGKLANNGRAQIFLYVLVDKFLYQISAELTCGGAILDLLLVSNEDITGGPRVENNPD